MRFTTYSKFVAGMADQVNLQSLLDQLQDFLLQSGFAGTPWWGDPGDRSGERSLDDLRAAILRALMESGQLTPDMLKLLRGESTGDDATDAETLRAMAEMLDKIVQRLIDEGYLKLDGGGTIPPPNNAGRERDAARTVQFDLTEKG